jgi:hypothetical protein
MMLLYGPPDEHETEEAKSRFFSPVRTICNSLMTQKLTVTQIFNHLVKQFTFTLRNTPEAINDDRIGNRGYIKHSFKAFGAIAILCIEMMPRVGNGEERLSAIAQMILECVGRHAAHEVAICY